MLVLTGVVSLGAVVGAASEGCATTVGGTTAAAAWPSCIASQDCSSMGKPTTGMGDGGGADSRCGDTDDGVDCSGKESTVGLGVDGGSGSCLLLLVCPSSSSPGAGVRTLQCPVSVCLAVPSWRGIATASPSDGRWLALPRCAGDLVRQRTGGRPLSGSGRSSGQADDADAAVAELELSMKLNISFTTGVT